MGITLRRRVNSARLAAFKISNEKYNQLNNFPTNHPLYPMYLKNIMFFGIPIGSNYEGIGLTETAKLKDYFNGRIKILNFVAEDFQKMFEEGALSNFIAEQNGKAKIPLDNLEKMYIESEVTLNTVLKKRQSLSGLHKALEKFFKAKFQIEFFEMKFEDAQQTTAAIAIPRFPPGARTWAYAADIGSVRGT